MPTIREDTARATRHLPITQQLKDVLNKAAEAAGIELVRVTSGGQPPTGPDRTGSHRHDNGNAADLELWKEGRALNFTRSDERPVIAAFVIAAAANGATGIGAGIDYMGPKTLHVGFGSKMIWGAGGKSANAPDWLRNAVTKGWEGSTGGTAPAPDIPESLPTAAGRDRFVVIARGGLKLRGGPGLEFAALQTLDTGTEVTVLDMAGDKNDWARVDLEGDGLVDGFLFAAFLAPADAEEHEDHSAGAGVA
jgi:hypothetical protein